MIDLIISFISLCKWVLRGTYLLAMYIISSIQNCINFFREKKIDFMLLSLHRIWKDRILVDNLYDGTRVKGVWSAEVTCFSSLKMKFNWDKYKALYFNKQENKKSKQVKDRWLWIIADVQKSMIYLPKFVLRQLVCSWNKAGPSCGHLKSLKDVLCPRQIIDYSSSILNELFLFSLTIHSPNSLSFNSWLSAWESFTSFMS